MAVEEAEERLAKFSVHETVRDGVAAAGDVGQQLHQADAGATDDRVHQLGLEEIPGIDHVQRRPAHEELEDYDEEHPDHLQPAAATAFNGQATSCSLSRVLMCFCDRD